VWVSVIRDGTVVRIDPTTDEVDRRVRLSPAGSQPEGLAWDGAHLWVVDQAGGRAVELDPAGTVVASYRTGAEPRLAAAGDGAVWIANYGGTSVSRVAHGRVRTVSLPGCSGPQGIAEAAGRVWVACTLSGKAVALDARTMRQVAEVPGLPDADAVVADGATVYVVGQSGPTVYAIGSRSGSLTRTVRLDDVPGTTENVGAAVVGSDLVVTQPDVRKVYSLPLP
jgi:sugar lactone lactonase YvrE